MYSRVYVEITNICNMNCSFCHGHNRAPRQMTEAEYARVLQQLTGKTQYIYHHLMGEPLVHPLLPRFTQMAAQAGFRPMLTTNGTLLDRLGDSLLIEGLHKVNISLHSFEEGQPDAHKNYIRKVAEFSHKANQAGIIISLRLWNNGCDDGRNPTALTCLKENLPGQWAGNTRGYRIRDKLFLEWGDRFVWPDQNAPIGDDCLYCHGLQDHFGILCDGTVVPCCLDSDGIIALGNVFEEELSDILASPRAKAIAEGFRQRKAVEDLCRRCGYARKF
ncbi:MAG: SPASM domain-containing protein [Oscillospiraceae bacterium]|nr:SPASM domain-containing protein [Oscillospiraceae bacterium]